MRHDLIISALTLLAAVTLHAAALVSDTFHSKINWLPGPGVFGLGDGSENS
jgi:hypothetical protein